MAVSVDYFKPGQGSRRGFSRGFTVVETMIVLAIAGLMLLIVFEAIPTLERNSRNNQRRQDVQAVLQTISRWELNNSGNIPDQGQLQHFIDTYEKRSLTFYASTDITVSQGSTNIGGTYPPADVTFDADKMYVYNHAKCDANGDGMASNTGAGYSDVVALFAIETSGNPSKQCRQL